MNIHYVVSVFLGNRRNKSKNADPFYCVRKHLNFLAQNPWYTSTFVCNKFVPEIDDLLPKIAKEYDVSNLKIIFRDNVDCSYGAWHQAVIEYIHKELDYHFLIEDDYTPANPWFLTPFVNKMSPNVHYVCSKMLKKPLHASVSNGLLSHALAQKVFEKHQKVFMLCGAPATNKPTLIGTRGIPWPLPNYRRSLNGLDYGMCERNQVHFLDYFEGTKLEEIADEYQVPFLMPTNWVKQLGGDAYAPIIPIIIEKKVWPGDDLMPLKLL